MREAAGLQQQIETWRCRKAVDKTIEYPATCWLAGCWLAGCCLVKVAATEQREDECTM